MRVAVVHNAVAPEEKDPATLDVLEQVEFIGGLLAKTGHGWKAFALDRNVRDTLTRLRAFKPDRIFNLVESVGGDATLHPCAAALWELLGIPHTGASSFALALTTDKSLANSFLVARGLPTPEWAVCRGEEENWRAVPSPWILKPTLEDGSVGIDEDNVVRDAAFMPDKLRAMQERFPDQAILVEHFVDGREFHVAILGSPTGPRPLPPVEIVFLDYPPGKERILTFRAKWEPSSFEYEHTHLRLDFPPEESSLLEQLQDLAVSCWHAFHLRGYARVDMRVGEGGQPFVLEINANPRLSPDGLFGQAVARAGLTQEQMLEMILEDCVWTA